MPKTFKNHYGKALTLFLAVILSGCLGGSNDQARDPVVSESPVAYIKRPLLFDENNGQLVTDDAREPASFRPGARLFLKESASPDAPARDITSRAFAGGSFLNEQGQLRYDVKGLEVSYDGRKLLFAMRAPEIEDADEEDQPTWNIWEYDTEASRLRRIISSDVNAEAGQDIAPAYLPDGSIVFSSTRQRTSQAVLLDEGKPQYPALDEEMETAAFLLHVMKDDGSDIEQITFNQSHDLDPVVLDNGKILFSRWDNAGQTPDNGINLYQVNPDGTGLNYLYGRHSHDSAGNAGAVQFLRPVETDSGRMLVQIRPFESAGLSSLPAFVDVANFVEADVRIDGSAGQGQSALVPGLNAFGEAGLNGTYGAIYPLFDGSARFLVSWSPCRLVRVGSDGTITNCTESRLASSEYQAARPIFGLWLLDPAEGTQRPIEVASEGQQYDEALLMTARPLPEFLMDPVPTDEARNLGEEGFGIVHIRSVYDFDGVDTAPGGTSNLADPAATPPSSRPARFLRVEKPVSIPGEEVFDFDNSAFGRSRNQSMREILGYVPVEPDGSVRMAVPANVAFAISVLDDRGRRIGERHQNWLQVRPGETMECIGCHTSDSEVPHGRKGAGPAPANRGATTTGQEFPNTEPALFADMGETMAETITRIKGIRRLTADLVYDDEWTDPDVVPKADSFSWAYADLATAAPMNQACAGEWSSRCRLVINYENHIHPLWNLARPIFDTDGVTQLDDVNCTSCHSDVDAVGATQVPVAQLDLSDGPSAENALILKSYRELLFNDSEQELMNGALLDTLVDTGEFERDEDGELILDGAGDPIPMFATIPVRSSMSTNGARASARFLNRFHAGGSHEGFLSDVEHKLIAEWLDVGAQYFNNPFEAPED
ncbi:hypothetical protein [Marinobacter sp.]|uniref:HzsA-related protein n=1 Tax=Marinobacter sp. TaxID=50741 RepID=UPI00384C9627